MTTAVLWTNTKFDNRALFGPFSSTAHAVEWVEKHVRFMHADSGEDLAALGEWTDSGDAAWGNALRLQSGVIEYHLLTLDPPWTSCPPLQDAPDWPA